MAKGTSGKIHTVIVAGGQCDLSEYKELLDEAYLIGADRGALYLAAAGYSSDLAIGDFDSVNEEELEVICKNSAEIKRLPEQKDATDLEAAVEHAIMLAGAIHILGATGTRLDQTAGAINLLKACLDKNKEAYIYDSHNRIRLIEGGCRLKKSRYRYVSLIPYGDVVENVSLTGFKYSGDGITLERRSSLGISNEITDDEALINCIGYLFVFESTD